jgi:hypothetical protein
MDALDAITRDELLREFWWALQQPDEDDDAFIERLKDASWKGLTGQRYVVSSRSTSGMGPMPGVEDHMDPESMWGAWCNVCLDGVVATNDIVQHWYWKHVKDHQAQPENNYETAYQKAAWELRTTGHVTHETVFGLMERIRDLEHRLRGTEIGALLKETDGEVQEAEADAGDDDGS